MHICEIVKDKNMTKMLIKLLIYLPKLLEIKSSLDSDFKKCF